MIRSITRPTTAGKTLALVAIAVAVLCILFPHGAYAQPSSVERADDLRATIQRSLLSDPRTSGLSQSEIDAMVSILMQEAQKQGLTAEDITWQPQNTETTTDGKEDVQDACDPSSFLCKISAAFGFVGSDTTIPFMLGASSMALIWICAEMLHRRRKSAA